MRAKTVPKQTAKAGSELEERLGHTFASPELLRRALTHRSLAFEKGAEGTRDDNEQLEFLGDAVLGLLVADELLKRFGDLREGDLTRMRALLVSRKATGEVGQRLGLGDHLRLGRGEEGSGGRRKPVLLANATEAVLAALYLDGGLEVARALVQREIVEPRLAELERAAQSGPDVGGAVGDYKSALQEKLQSSVANSDGKTSTKMTARYVVAAESGPDHNKHFRVELTVSRGGEAVVVAAGEGATKKTAQQEAARAAYLQLEGKRD